MLEYIDLFAKYERILKLHELGLTNRLVADASECSIPQVKRVLAYYRKAKNKTLTEAHETSHPMLCAWAIQRAANENHASSELYWEKACKDLESRLHRIKYLLLERAEHLRVLSEFVNDEFDITPLFTTDCDTIAEVNHHYDEICTVLQLLETVEAKPDVAEEAEDDDDV